MTEFQQHFFNACAKIAKMPDQEPKALLDTYGLDGEFLLTAINEALGQIPVEERLAFGILLGIQYERERITHDFI